MNTEKDELRNRAAENDAPDNIGKKEEEIISSTQAASSLGIFKGCH